MILKRTVDPTEEPVSVTEAKAHLRVDLADDDLLIGSLVTAARQYIEDTAARALCTQTWRLSLDEWPTIGYIELPRPPLQTVSSIVYTDSAAVAHTFSTDYYDVDTDSEPGRVVLEYGDTWPTGTLASTNPIQVTYVAGYGAVASVPQHLKQAILLLTAHWYENREAVMVAQGTTIQNLPLAIDSLIWLNRVF